MSSGTRRASLASSAPSDWLLICRSSKKRAQHMLCCNSYKARRRECPLSRGSSHLDLDRSLGKFALHLAVIVSSFDPVHIAVVCRRVVIDIAPQFFAVCPGCTEKLLLILLADARAMLNQGRDSLILCTTSAIKPKCVSKNCDHIAVKQAGTASFPRDLAGILRFRRDPTAAWSPRSEVRKALQLRRAASRCMAR